jgi:hypothetical protein
MGSADREAAVDKKTYTLGEAARVADATVDELLKSIKDGLLPARIQQNTGEYGIDSEDLAKWIRRSRHADPFRQVKKKKVLVLGEDILFSGTLKLELQRNDHLDVRFATWGNDAVVMVNHYNADLYVIDLTPSRNDPDAVLAAVAGRRAEGSGAVIATSAQPKELIDANPLLKGRLGALAPEGFIPRAGGMRPLLVAIFACLGLQTNTRVIKRQA